MACSCRTAPLRSFLSGLAQVHRLDSPLSQPLLRSRSRATLPRTAYRDAAAFRSLRRFHATTRIAQEATKATDAAADSLSTTASISPTADSAVSEGIVESTSVQKPNTKKKQRWREKDENELAKLKEKQAKGRAEGSKNQAKKAKKQKKKSAAKKDTNSITENKGIQTIRRKDGITISTYSRNNTDKSRGGSRNKPKSWPKPAESTPLVEKLAAATTEETGPKHQEEKLPDWRVQKEALKEKFPHGWRPRKRLSPDALAGIRALNAQYPDIYTTAALSAKFEVDPEAIRRILKSKWQPSAEEEEKRLQRWQKRGTQIWETKAALGIKPPKKWREDGVTRDPSWHAWRRKVAHREQEWEDEEKRVYREQRAASLQSRIAGKVL